MMSIGEKRQALHQRIDELDDKFINAVYAMVEAYVENDNQIVGYQPNGDPITLSELKSNIKISEQQYEQGNYSTLDDLEKEMKSW